MSKGEKSSSGRASHAFPNKVVRLAEEKVRHSERVYGLMKTANTDTPYPQKNKPVDLIALAAKLEEEKKQSRVSINSGPERKSSKYSVYDDLKIERQRTFAEQRKLFDKGEFTICKGRKLSDSFHPLNFDDHDLRFEALCTTILERKSMDNRNFEELAAYCRENRINMFTGHDTNN
ncbi:hypothetical protein KR054_006119 [Drosophila jambulina]|nr:hypothetical protein KR054_006119 [Drosophila jambulina]